MYSVYADNNLIYLPDMADVGYYITSPTYVKEVNKAGSFEFNIYTTNPYYDQLKALKTVVSVRDDNYEIWRGRILSMERAFDNRRAVYCEGTLSFLVDSIIRPHDHKKTMAEQFQYLIDQHNSQVDDFKKFRIARIDIEDPYGSIQWKTDTYEKTKDKIENIVTTYGGYLLTRYENGENTIYYMKDPSRFSNQVIDSTENLLDLTESINPSNVFTVLIPIAYDSNGNKITIESVNDGKDYIESADGIAKFGRIFYSHTFSDDISSASELLEKGTAMLAENIKAAQTLSLKAFDLHMIDPDVDRIDIYDKIKVQSRPHSLDEYEMCTKVSISLENPENSEYIIGTIPQNITSNVATLQTGSNTLVQKTASGGGSSTIPDGDTTQY